MSQNKNEAKDRAAKSRVGDARYVAHVGVIAAAYAVCTLVAMMFLGSLAWGPSNSASARPCACWRCSRPRRFLA